jgi:hypothetical protein
MYVDRTLASKHRGFAWLLAAVGLVASLQLVMFCVAATRGLDLTDESYYLLSFRYWAEAPAASLFGAYLSLPYALVGQSVWAIRIFGFLLLFGTGFWCALEVIRGLQALEGADSQSHVWPSALAGAAGIWSYYGAAPGPYTPSYNLLALACALAGTALSVRIGRAIFQHRPRHVEATAFALGMVMSIGIATKFSAGVLMVGLDAAIIASFAWKRIEKRMSWRLLLSTALGILANVALLLAIDHDLITRFRQAVVIAIALLPRSPAEELTKFVVSEILTDLAQSARILMWPVILGAAIAATRGRLLGPRLTAGLAAVCFIGVTTAFIYVKDNRIHRFALLALFALCLLAVALWMQRSRSADFHGRRTLVMAACLICMPFAYAFGTNNPLLYQMGMAAVFPGLLATSQVRSLHGRGWIPSWAFGVGLLFITALPAEIAARQWLSGQYTYRLGAPLSQQTSTLTSSFRGIDIAVEPRVAEGIARFLDLARSAGFVPGQRMIDFTGQSPGLVALSDGVPLGAMWLIGGPPFDGDRSAAAALDFVPAQDIRKAWLVTSTNSFARIGTWRSILERKQNAFGHVETGRITLPDPTSNDKGKTMDVSLWRPQQ